MQAALRRLLVLPLLAGMFLLAPLQAAPARSSIPGDPLAGSGDVPRTLLLAADLLSGSSTAPLDDAAFALPAEAAMPLHQFEGRLELLGEANGGGFAELRDDYNYTDGSDTPRKHLPELSVELVQSGSHLIPAVQGLQFTGHVAWNLLLGPGRAWAENGDGGYSRAALPFALVQRNANCTHNGVISFLFTNTSISNVRYQITQETCFYFKFDMWGQLAANYTAYTLPNAATLIGAHAAEVANRLPVKPIDALAIDYPAAGIDTAVFGAGISPEHLSSYGLLYNGVNYVGGCGTRYGSYAFCDQLRLPSYSTAKSLFAGVALMRLGQKYGIGVYNLLIRNYVSETSRSSGDWRKVTFNHTIDMATGNYRSSGNQVDEAGVTMQSFFLAEPYSEKINLALSYPRQRNPGSLWVYHTSDTFLLTRAMNNYLRSRAGTSAEIFAMLRDEVYKPLGLSSGALSTLRTDNSAGGQAFGGYGLFWVQDDIARLAQFLNNQGGMIGGTQILQPAMLADSMQQDPGDRGLSVDSTTRYNNGFWARQFTAAAYPQYSCSFYVPFMSGYGGITVAMMPNGATYYYFSDNEEFVWMPAVNEADKLAPQCR